jgi:hypothetical protein
MLLTLLANNLNPTRVRIVEATVPVLVNEDSNYSQYRTNLTAPLLFWRSVPVPAAALSLYQTSYRLPEIEGDYSRFNHSSFFQFVSSPLGQPAPAAVVSFFKTQFVPPDVEPDYSRFNHQVFFQYPQTTVPSPPSFSISTYPSSIRPPDLEGDYARTNQQTIFQFIQPPGSTGLPGAFSLLQKPTRLPELELDYSRFNHQGLFQLLGPAITGASPSAVVSLFQVSYRSPEIEGDYPRTNQQGLFQFIPAPAQIVITPPPAGGLLPGRPPYTPQEMEQLGKGMGPYRRPGQVFGEQDPPSPRMTSQAPTIPLTVIPPSWVDIALDSDDELVFALVALEELCGSDWMSNPITLHIVRRKV